MKNARDKLSHPSLTQNKVGLVPKDYHGEMSTLCGGCGHDSISAAIASACYELSLEPHTIAKLSGIGCSSKTAAYFLKSAHALNSVHGRMPSVATGANLAARNMKYLGVSGDGDTCSIGLGQFIHGVRRGINMVYLCANNGIYGLTKGQFSATSSLGVTSKNGQTNPYVPIDPIILALEAGASFVARSFSGDKNQLVPLIKAAISHHGFAFIDIISPCVTFNNHASSDKSYGYVQDNQVYTASIQDYVESVPEIMAEQTPGRLTSVLLSNGEEIFLKAVSEDFDVYDKEKALQLMRSFSGKKEILTGLIYLEKHSHDMHQTLGTTLENLRDIDLSKLTLSELELKEINESFS